jgi:hypothetical protein
MQAQYLETVAVLFGIYLALRMLIWWQLRLPRRRPYWEDDPGPAIDATRLVDRLEQVRRDYESGLAGRPASFKKPLLVEQRREELEKLSYFRRHAEAAHPEDDEQMQPSPT